MKRRHFLQGLAAGTVIVAGGIVWRAVDQGVFAAGTGPAYEPWRDWQSVAGDSPLALVSAAILASNPHNTQPWMFRVHRDAVELFAERGRNLGSFDPYLREMHLGLGCAVENMMITARAMGYAPDLELEGGTLQHIEQQQGRALVARVRLRTGSVEGGALHGAISRRHTNRGAYDPDRGVPSGLERVFMELADDAPGVGVRLFTDNETLQRMRELVVDATQAIIDDEPMVHDSERWFRHSWRDIQAHRDGPTLDAAGLPPLMSGMAKMMPRSSAETNHRYWLQATRDVHVATAPAMGVITVESLYDREQTLQAGRVWQRLHLWATTQGLAMQPLNQPVERVDRDRELGLEPRAARAMEFLTGRDTGAPTFCFRVGYALRNAPPSPRRSVDQVLI